MDPPVLSIAKPAFAFFQALTGRQSAQQELCRYTK
jgi:hypothetical protein